MRKSVGICEYLFDITHEPLQQIDCMDRLIDQCPAPVKFPCPPPCTTIIVLLASIPFDLGIRHDDLTKTALFDGLFYQYRSLMVPGRKYSGELNIIQRTFGDDSVASFFGYLKWFFDNHMFFCTSCRDGTVKM